MAEKVSVYLSQEAVDMLDKLVEARSKLFSASTNRSSTVSDLLVHEGEHMLAELKLAREAIDHYQSLPSSPREQGDDAVHDAAMGNVAEYVDDMGVGDE